MASATDMITEEPRADAATQIAPPLVYRPDMIGPLDATEAAQQLIDDYLAAKAERERHRHMPLRVFGESRGDHIRRGARLWSDAPDVMPLGEEGGTAWTPDNAWLREETGVKAQS